jgi:hypothetical protein
MKKTLGWRLQACASLHALSPCYKRKVPFLYGAARVRNKRQKMTSLPSLPYFSFPTFLFFLSFIWSHECWLSSIFFFFFFHFFLVFYKIASSFLFFFSFGIHSSVLGRDVLEPSDQNVFVFLFLYNST